MHGIAERLAALLPDDMPEEAGIGYVAELFNLTPGAVHAAIRANKLSARPLRSSNGRVIHIVNLTDAAILWGHRLVPKEDA